MTTTAIITDIQPLLAWTTCQIRRCVDGSPSPLLLCGRKSALTGWSTPRAITMMPMAPWLIRLASPLENTSNEATAMTNPIRERIYGRQSGWDVSTGHQGTELCLLSLNALQDIQRERREPHQSTSLKNPMHMVPFGRSMLVEASHHGARGEDETPADKHEGSVSIDAR